MCVSEDFKYIKNYFIERQNKFVIYSVKDKDSSSYSYYFTPQKYRDIFYIEFDAGYSKTQEGKYYIDSYDSFVLGIQFVDYGDRIEVSDFNRSWECGVEAFEGNGLMYKHLNKVKEVAIANKLTITETEIHKITSKKTFIDDAIKLIKVMLMINYMKDKPPYISGNKYIWEDVRSLKASWEKQK